MNLFDPEFFPTPDEVIARMVEPYTDRLAKATILEPSAGNGAILEFITKKGIETKRKITTNYSYTDQVYAKSSQVYAIEKNPELTIGSPRQQRPLQPLPRQGRLKAETYNNHPQKSTT